ncbi:3126_t:CDS:2 [Cetraspora pellucida]|uniref:3126_t:CDS:1 n=1 Tax=Cetraspora pellucida TaxID=1433469 RepID=A0ACA9KT55_9GLOM|nr:3126_t:CDS:2 [Cetraspora pellucida]
MVYFSNLGIQIRIAGSWWCTHYPDGKIIDFYTYDNVQAGFSLTGYEHNLIHQLQKTENFIKTKISDQETKYQNLVNKIEKTLGNLGIELDNNKTIDQKLDNLLKIKLQKKSPNDIDLKINQIMKNLNIEFNTETSFNEKINNIVSCTENLNKF